MRLEQSDILTEHSRVQVEQSYNLGGGGQIECSWLSNASQTRTSIVDIEFIL